MMPTKFEYECIYSNEMRGTRKIYYYYGLNFFNVCFPNVWVEQAWRSDSVMDCQLTDLCSIPGGNGVKTEFHGLRKGQ